MQHKSHVGYPFLYLFPFLLFFLLTQVDLFIYFFTTTDIHQMLQKYFIFIIISFLFHHHFDIIPVVGDVVLYYCNISTSSFKSETFNTSNKIFSNWMYHIEHPSIFFIFFCKNDQVYYKNSPQVQSISHNNMNETSSPKEVETSRMPVRCHGFWNIFPKLYEDNDGFWNIFLKLYEDNAC